MCEQSTPSARASWHGSGAAWSESSSPVTMQAAAKSAAELPQDSPMTYVSASPAELSRSALERRPSAGTADQSTASSSDPATTVDAQPPPRRRIGPSRPRPPKK